MTGGMANTSASITGGSFRGHVYPHQHAPTPSARTYAASVRIRARPAPARSNTRVRQARTQAHSPPLRQPMYSHAYQRAGPALAPTGARARWRRYPLCVCACCSSALAHTRTSVKQWAAQARGHRRPCTLAPVPTGLPLAYAPARAARPPFGRRRHAVTGARAYWRRYPPTSHWRMRARARCSSALAHTRTSVKQWAAQAPVHAGTGTHWRMRPRAQLVRPCARTHVSGEAVARRRRAAGKRAVTGARACWGRSGLPLAHARPRALLVPLVHTRTRER
ncbi:hypothetical protein GGX14DRAFT_561927 [Mycena pura]|uniref:Uncharacterized protein n=1 Tax=Mycena pura TaxID=153505 RepID=A0AAD6YIK0_9AGAR|nr:hypothetical protein GGX14DRAFT_561927 [Mycena pura]